jgi:hypothetical protein
LAQAVLPATKDASNFVQAAQEEVPNVLDYAQKTGNPLNTQLEFSKAAQGYAQEVRDIYEKQILAPNDKMVATGTDFGRTQGEGPAKYAMLSDIDKRITAINKQLDAPALNADDARRALASKSDLQAEAAKLRTVLHNNLAQATGLDPEDIANIRQRVGRSYELANDTNAAVTARMQAEGKTDMGPIHLSQIPSQAISLARGGITAIADRAFQRAIANFPGAAESLPEIESVPPPTPGPQRSPIWEGQQPLGHPPVEAPVPDTQTAMQIMAEKLANRPSAQSKLFSSANTTKAPSVVDPAIVARNQRLLQMLKIAQTPVSPNQR